MLLQLSDAHTFYFLYLMTHRHVDDYREYSQWE